MSSRWPIRAFEEQLEQVVETVRFILLLQVPLGQNSAAVSFDYFDHGVNVLLKALVAVS